MISKEQDTDRRVNWPLWPFPAYLGLLGVIGLWYSKGDRDFRLPPRAAWFFVPAFLYLVVSAVASGRVPARGSDIERAKQPIFFWLLVSAFVAFAVATALVGAGILKPPR